MIILIAIILITNNVDTTSPPDGDSLSVPLDSQAGTTSSENGKFCQHHVYKTTIIILLLCRKRCYIYKQNNECRSSETAHVQPIPENPHDPVIQKVFANIRKKNANFTLMQNGTELSTDFKVTPVTV